MGGWGEGRGEEKNNNNFKTTVKEKLKNEIVVVILHGTEAMEQSTTNLRVNSSVYGAHRRKKACKSLK
jgi:thioredoxin reductase